MVTAAAMSTPPTFTDRRRSTASSPTPRPPRNRRSRSSASSPSPTPTPAHSWSSGPSATPPSAAVPPLPQPTTPGLQASIQGIFKDEESHKPTKNAHGLLILQDRRRNHPSQP